MFETQPLPEVVPWASRDPKDLPPCMFPGSEVGRAVENPTLLDRVADGILNSLPPDRLQKAYFYAQTGAGKSDVIELGTTFAGLEGAAETAHRFHRAIQRKGNLADGDMRKVTHGYACEILDHLRARMAEFPKDDAELPRPQQVFKASP